VIWYANRETEGMTEGATNTLSLLPMDGDAFYK
jgi:hypothetical protein